MTRLLATTMLAALIAVPAMAQSDTTGTSQTVIPSGPPRADITVQAPVWPQYQSARPADDWQAAIHENGDAGVAPLPSEVGVGSPPPGFSTPNNPPYDDKGGG